MGQRAEVGQWLSSVPGQNVSALTVPPNVTAGLQLVEEQRKAKRTRALDTAAAASASRSSMSSTRWRDGSASMFLIADAHTLKNDKLTELDVIGQWGCMVIDGLYWDFSYCCECNTKNYRCRDAPYRPCYLDGGVFLSCTASDADGECERKKQEAIVPSDPRAAW